MFRALGGAAVRGAAEHGRHLPAALRRATTTRSSVAGDGGLVAWTAFAVWAYAAAGPPDARAAGRRPRRRGGRDRAHAVRQGRGVQRDPARLLGDGRGAGLGGAVALAWRARGRGGRLGRRPGHPRRTSTRRPTATSSCSSSAAPIVGFLSGLLQEMAAQRDRAERAAAAAEERQRLARVVHDGVLQALALVQRRAPELGPDGVELGRLAGEQEVRLRGLVQQDSREPVAPLGDVDLAELLSALRVGDRARRPPRVGRGDARRGGRRGARGRRVVPEQRPPPRRARGRGLGAARGARRPLGGLGARRRARASARDGWRSRPHEGRLGVRQSIVGRLEDLGGTATVDSAPGRGTEWELSLPRSRVRR